jgi:hypothetical protein
MKFVSWFVALGLMTLMTACGGPETPETEMEEDVPATEEMEEEPEGTE